MVERVCCLVHDVDTYLLFRSFQIPTNVDTNSHIFCSYKKTALHVLFLSSLFRVDVKWDGNGNMYGCGMMRARASVPFRDLGYLAL